MGLFEPFWLKKYPAGTVKEREKGSREIEKWRRKIADMTDEAKLKEIAVNAVYDSYRHEAEKRIRDQSVLRELARKFHDREAIERLSDSEDILKEVVLTEEDGDIVGAALKGISDDSFLKELLEKAVKEELPCEQEDKRRNARSAVIAGIALRIRDEDYLFRIASGQLFRNGLFRDERAAVASRMGDEEKLFLLAKGKETEDDVAKAAIRKMKDTGHLEWIRDRMNPEGVYPTKGMVAADRLKQLNREK